MDNQNLGIIPLSLTRGEENTYVINAYVLTPTSMMKTRDPGAKPGMRENVAGVVKRNYLSHSTLPKSSSPKRGGGFT